MCIGRLSLVGRGCYGRSKQLGGAGWKKAYQKSRNKYHPDHVKHCRKIVKANERLFVLLRRILRWWILGCNYNQVFNRLVGT